MCAGFFYLIPNFFLFHLFNLVEDFPILVSRIGFPFFVFLKVRFSTTLANGTSGYLSIGIPFLEFLPHFLKLFSESITSNIDFT